MPAKIRSLGKEFLKEDLKCIWCISKVKPGPPHWAVLVISRIYKLKRDD